MLKLRFSKPSFTTHCEGRITVCRYECLIIDNEAKTQVAKFNATGVAKCAPNDTMDERYGRMLADSRAKLNAYRMAGRILPIKDVRFIQNFIKQSTDSLSFVIKMRQLKNKELEHIEVLKVKQ